MKMVKAADVAWAPVMPDVEGVPDIAFLQGDPAVGPFVSMMRFPAGYSSGMHSHDADYTGGVVRGACQHGDGASMTGLADGSVWRESQRHARNDVCVDTAPCLTFQVVYGAMSFNPVAAE